MSASVTDNAKVRPDSQRAMHIAVNSQEFHELCMDYRGAPAGQDAQAAFERLQQYVINQAAQSDGPEDEAVSLLRRIANANVIFPSMCANNTEAYSINDALAEYRTKPSLSATPEHEG